nr:AMP-binding protein [Sulfolobus acidocaldarius]
MIDGAKSTTNDDWQLSVHKVLEYAGKVHPTTEIISDRRLQGGELHILNYGKVLDRVRSMANALEKELDVKPSDVVGIIDWNDHRFFESYFSVPSIGGVLLELNFRLHPSDLVYIVKHTKAKGLFIDDSLLLLAQILSKEYKFDFIVVMSDKSLEEIEPLKGMSLASKVYGYEELVKSHSPNRRFEEVNEKSAAYAAFTSGTTGLPKGVFYSHRSVVLHAMTVAHDMRPTDTLLQVVPMFHANGWGTPFAAAMQGCRQIYPGRPTPESLTDYILNYKVTRTAAVPTIIIELLKRLEKMDPKPDLKGLKISMGGQEPPSKLVSELAKYGVEVYQGYGATETSPVVSVGFSKSEIDNLPAEDKFLKMKQGLIVFGVEVKVVDPITNQELPWDGKSVGEIWIRGPWITREYYNDPRTSQSFTPDGWWRSGDVGVVDPLGYIRLVDRLKDVIKSGGEWISSIDLENFLMAHPYVREASVVGVPKPSSAASDVYKRQVVVSGLVVLIWRTF